VKDGSATSHPTGLCTIYKNALGAGQTAARESPMSGTKPASLEAMAERLCAHEPCHCEPRPGEQHCGSICARAAESAPRAGATARCACGHPECRPENVPPDQPPPVAQP
jgi:hypothetical protein